MIVYTADTLDEFVRLVDAAGGLGSPEAQPHLAAFSFRVDVPIDTTLDPFSEAYVQQQVELYRRISGRDLDQAVNELSSFDIEWHASASNPYAMRDPSAFVLHHLRIGRAVRNAKLPPAPRVLDMGAGWGLTTEFFAMLGAEVVAVDINPDFVELVRRRAERLSLPITPVQAAFDTVEPDGLFDLVFFYESLHHAVKPWEVIARCARGLKPDGVFALAGEPIQEYWWPQWGLRLDAGSVYCVRKFGWFESGWSKAFAVAMFERAGLFLSLSEDADPEVGLAGVARFHRTVEMSETLDCAGEGWTPGSWGWLGSSDMTLGLPSTPSTGAISLQVVNYRPSPLAVTLRGPGKDHPPISLPPGRSEIAIPQELFGKEVTLQSETWNPAEEIGNGDARWMSFVLERLEVSTRR